ncbi:polysaccharide pyruvyl transferase family protein [Hydrogenophaga sp. ZJX-1]|uniref:polysaccharide pyruvyl transferase family protein n=1 Tax=Hydrogenophaga sp. ZJX-1 TaxID=3404778 RepID=UPI003B2878DA
MLDKPPSSNSSNLAPKAAILTFHNTPNFGATLQCFALTSFLQSKGMQVEVINYMPPHNLLQYGKSLFLGKRRSAQNFSRILKFYHFVKSHIRMSGAPVFSSSKLRELTKKEYDIAFTGSDEVWKVDHMRKFDPSYYLSFLNEKRTRLVAYAATASTVTNLHDYKSQVSPLLSRFSALGIRDSSTKAMVDQLTSTPSQEVLDPTLIWNFESMDLPPLFTDKYVAVYSWLSDSDMSIVRDFASSNNLKVVCVGCRHRHADMNFLGIGPEEWLRLIKHSSTVITDFFHGVLFSIIFKRPFFAHVDEKKKMKLTQALAWVGLNDRLHSNFSALISQSPMSLDADWENVKMKLSPLRLQSISFLEEQIMSASSPSRTINNGFL